MSNKPATPSPGARRQKLSPALRAAVLAGAVLAGAVLAALSSANAAPATLANDADLAAFATRMKAYAGASRVRWIVSAKTQAEAESVVAGIGAHLAPADHALLARVRPMSFADAPSAPAGASIPIGWMAPQMGQAQGGPSCSWQVWVSDPEFPSADAGPVNLPLAPNDKLPVGAAATFRVGHSGLVQSRLYAFDETAPGAIRDLASAPDINIPVAPAAGETIVLAMSRQPAPFLESIKQALAASAGQRRDLGKDYALRDNLLGRGRGIGANIQVVEPGMVVAKNDAGAPTPGDPKAPAGALEAGELMETCLFSLTPAPKP